jgi:hypothetical protein
LEKVLRKKAEADGLDPKTVDAAVSQRTSRRYLIAAAMKGCGNNDDDINCKLSTKSLRDKNLTRWIAENNVMPALSNAATCITTHAIEGKRPLEIGGPIDYDSLSDDVRETFDLAREALDADDVYFAHPSLIGSVDQSTLFGFEGVTEDDKDEREWKWVIIPQSDNTLASIVTLRLQAMQGRWEGAVLN